MTMTAAWATAIIEPNRDFEAQQRLTHDGFRTVLLAYRHRLTGHNRPGWRKACEFVPRPLFPGYLFVELLPDQAWPKQGTGGFLEFVCAIRANRRPLMLPHETIWAWKMLVASGEFDDKPPLLVQITRKFQPANDPAERRRLLLAKFSTMLQSEEIDDLCA